jgi:hypothetical protein
LTRCGTLMRPIANCVRAISAFLPGEAELTDEIGREVDKRGALQEKCHRGLHTEVSANGVPDPHGHQRIHAQFGQRLVDLDS